VSALLVRDLVSVTLAVAAKTLLIVRVTRATKIAMLKAATLLVATLRLICPTPSLLKSEALQCS
jgi:hypothetical protein